MKTFQQPGDSVDLVAPSGGFVSGRGQLFGASLFGVAIATRLINETGAILIEGVVEIAKLSSDNMVVGAKVNWNNTNDEVQLATSTLDGVGTVVEAAAGSTTTVKIKLTPT